MNPLDWGNSPIAVSLIRGTIAAIIAGGVTYFGTQLTGTDEGTARLMAYVAVLTPLGALFTMGLSDQNRANNDIIIKGDVPVAAENIKVTGGT